MWAYFAPNGKLSLPGPELGAYFLRTKISARTCEPESRLVPPLVSLPARTPSNSSYCPLNNYLPTFSGSVQF